MLGDMGKSLTRREREEAAEEIGRRPAELPAPPVVALQRSAGNRAVSALIQRDEAAPPTVTMPFPMFGGAPRAPDLNIPPTSPLAGKPVEAMSEAVAAKVRTYLDGRRYEIGDLNQKGLISMPEVVQQVRENVPEAASAPVADIEKQVRTVFGGLTPPPTRMKRSAAGASAELGARIANALPGAPKVNLAFIGGSISLTMAGVVLTGKVGGAKVTTTGGPGGGEVEVEGDGKSVKATGKDDAFGLEAKLDRAAFAAKIEKDKNTGNWSKWEVGLRIAVVGDEPLEPTPDIPELQATMVKAEKAVRQIVEHLQAGGSPTDSKVKTLMEDVKPAIEGVKSAVDKRPKGPKVTVGAGVKGGDDKLGTTAGLSLIVQF
jgi:hypothetical protein